MLACTRLQWVNEGVNNISRDDWSLLPARSVIVFLSPTSTMTSSSEITWLNKDYIHTSLVTFGNHLIFFHERFHTLQKSNLILELRWNHRNHQRLSHHNSHMLFVCRVAWTAATWCFHQRTWRRKTARGKQGGHPQREICLHWRIIIILLFWPPQRWTCSSTHVVRLLTVFMNRREWCATSAVMKQTACFMWEVIRWRYIDSYVQLCRCSQHGQ